MEKIIIFCIKVSLKEYKIVSNHLWTLRNILLFNTELNNTLRICSELFNRQKMLLRWAMSILYVLSYLCPCPNAHGYLYYYDVTHSSNNIKQFSIKTPYFVYKTTLKNSEQESPVKHGAKFEGPCVEINKGTKLIDFIEFWI